MDLDIKDMFRIEIHKNINRIIVFFYRLGFWHRGDGKLLAKIFFSIYYTLFPISTLAGAISKYNEMESKVLLVESAMISIPLLMKLLYVIWKKREILELLNRICVYHIDNAEVFTAVNDKLNTFMAFASLLLCSAGLSTVSISFIVPFVGRERNLFLRVGFPLDWRNNDLSYWVAFMFVCTQMAFSAILVSFSIMIWYLMANCSWRYEILGQQVMRMGRMQSLESVKRHRTSSTESDNFYFRDLLENVNRNNDLIE